MSQSLYSHALTKKNHRKTSLPKNLKTGRSHTLKSTKKTTKTAGEESSKALADPAKYNPKEVAHAMSDDLFKGILESIELYHDKIDQDQFCAVYVRASDPLIPNLIRNKFYCWPWLPKPRPDQGVFLYDKIKGQIIKRLWVLPPPHTMAELASSQELLMAEPYRNMRDWSVAFFKGTFWEFIRYQHGIEMLSQDEYMELHGKELFKPDTNVQDADITETFDFSKIRCGDVANSE